MRKWGLLLVSAAALVVCMTLQAQDPGANLPEGPGKALLIRMCTGCHGLDEVASRHVSEEDWFPIIADMVGRGADGTNEEQAALAKYLGTYFGPGSRISAAAGPPAVAQAARVAQPGDSSAYLARCGKCHGPKLQGGDGPANLAYIRFHTDAEVTSLIRNGRPRMPALQIPDGELRQILATIRVLAGTNP